MAWLVLGPVERKKKGGERKGEGEWRMGGLSRRGARTRVCQEKSQLLFFFFFLFLNLRQKCQLVVNQESSHSISSFFLIPKGEKEKKKTNHNPPPFTALSQTERLATKLK